MQAEKKKEKTREKKLSTNQIFVLASIGALLALVQLLMFVGKYMMND